MLNNEEVETEETALAAPPTLPRGIEIPDASPVRLQTLDLARHIAIAPDKTQYVVATFDDSRVGRNYVSVVYPQLNGYLTLVRLPVCEYSTEDPEQAVRRHIALVEAIQQGKLRVYIEKNPQ